LETEDWDDPLKCANFIERFTSHNLHDVEFFKLEEFTRKDLEGIIQLLHGYYTHFIVNSAFEVRESLRCNGEDVLEGMMIASEIDIDENGEIILSDELWELVKKSPTLLKLLISAQIS
jgi:hypothetical protein